MPRENSFSLLKSVLRIFLLVFGVFWERCDSQVNREEANKPPGGRRGSGGAFFAMRSCQQLLHGDDGEFFSPDYLCSNPPLWCNWTIQVDPAKRIHLHLEDLTPNDDCHLKEDQVHVDEPAGGFRGHKVLQKCWREAKYTSSSNTLYVVLLIGGWPSPPYRGFYGRYRAFGPPVVYHPQEEFTETNRKSEPSAGLEDFNEIVMNEEQMDSDVPRRENQPPESETNSHIYPSNVVSTVPTFVHGTSRSERGATQTPSAWSDSAAPPSSPQQQHGGQNREPRPTVSSPKMTQTNVEEASARPQEASARPQEASARPQETSAHPQETSAHPQETSAHPQETSARPQETSARPLDASARPPEASARPPEASARPPEASARPPEASARPPEASARPQEAAAVLLEEGSAEGENRMEVREASDQLLVPFEAPEPEKPEQTHPPPYVVEPLSNHRGNLNIGNHSDVPHLPGDVNACGTRLCDANADCVNQLGSYSCRCRPGFQDKSRQGPGGTVCVDKKAAGCSSGLSAETKGVYVLFFLLSFLILMLLAAAGLLYHRHHRGEFLVRCRGGSPPDLKPPPHHCRRHHGASDLPPQPPPPARCFRERYPAADLPLLSFSALRPPDGFKERKLGKSEQSS